MCSPLRDNILHSLFQQLRKVLNEKKRHKISQRSLIYLTRNIFTLGQRGAFQSEAAECLFLFYKLTAERKLKFTQLHHSGKFIFVLCASGLDENNNPTFLLSPSQKQPPLLLHNSACFFLHRASFLTNKITIITTDNSVKRHTEYYPCPCI